MLLSIIHLDLHIYMPLHVLTSVPLLTHLTPCRLRASDRQFYWEPERCAEAESNPQNAAVPNEVDALRQQSAPPHHDKGICAILILLHLPPNNTSLGIESSPQVRVCVLGLKRDCE